MGLEEQNMGFHQEKVQPWRLAEKHSWIWPAGCAGLKGSIDHPIVFGNLMIIYIKSNKDNI